MAYGLCAAAMNCVIVCVRSE